MLNEIATDIGTKPYVSTRKLCGFVVHLEAEHLQ